MSSRPLGLGLSLDNPAMLGASLGGGGSGGISFVGGAIQASGGSISLTSLTGGSDTSPQEGDLVICARVLNYHNDQVFTPSAGATIISDDFATDSTSVNFASSYKIMGATPDTTAALTASNANSSVICALVFRGVDQTTPLDVTPTVFSAANHYNTRFPAITPVTSGAVIVGVGGTGHYYAADYNDPGGLKNFLTTSHLNGFNDSALAAAYDDTWESGEWPFVDVINSSTSSSTYGARIGHTIALRPAS